MTKFIKVIAAVALAAIGQTLFAYNGGYENSCPTNITIGGVTYNGFGNKTLSARQKTGYAYDTGTTIKRGAYAQCTALKTVDLTGVTAIEDAAFAYSALTSVELPATLKSIGYIPFGGCKSLASVTINSTAFMTSADEAKEPFRDCTALRTVTAKCAPPSWDFKKVFPNVTSVKVPSVNLSAWQAKKYSGVTVQESIVTYKVTFGKNGGTGGDDYVTAAYGVKPHDITVPKKSGYVFGGYWTTTGAGGVQYYGADGKATKAWDKTSAVTLWALWTKIVSCKVTLQKNGGTGGDSWVTVNTGSKPHDVTLPKKANSTFGGYWTTVQPGGVQYIGADGKAVRAWDKTADSTLWAKWSNKITFGKNGGTGGDEYVTAFQGVKPHDITPPTRAGYAFDGYWTTTGAGGVQYFYADGSAARAWDKTSNVTLWAKWISGTPVKITLGLNGGTGKTVVYAVKGKSMPRIGVPVRDGYAFGGYWTTTGTGGVQYYKADGTSAKSWDKTAATTLWAKWTAKAAAVCAPPTVGQSASARTETEPDEPAFEPGYCRGVFADGSGTFDLLLDEDGTAFFSAWTEDGNWTDEYEAELFGNTLVLTSENDWIVLRKEDGLVVAE